VLSLPAILFGLLSIYIFKMKIKTTLMDFSSTSIWIDKINDNLL